MMIKLISNLEDFEQLEQQWDDVYAADPQAQIFSSWAWLRGYYKASLFPWFVLAYKPRGQKHFVAFLPLSMHTRKFQIARTLRVGGAPISDYNTFVCLPQYEKKALNAFACYIQKHIKWDNFVLQDMLDSRLPQFLTAFPPDMANTTLEDYQACPYIPLLDSWDAHLASLSKTTRKKLKRRTTQVEELPNFRIEKATQKNFEDLLGTLTELWRLRWGTGALPIYKNVIRSCFRKGYIWLWVLWTGTEPLAGLCGFIDSVGGVFYSFMSGYNDKYHRLSPGKVLDGYSIRYAIENNYQIYDYLRGDSKFKFSLGAKSRYNERAIVINNSLRSTAVIQLLSWLKK